MLNRRNTNEMHHAKIDSIIGAEAVFEGDLRTSATTRIDGVIKGDIKSGGTLIIGVGGKVIGNIYATNIMVSGTVEGNLFAQEKIEAASTGVILGNIETKCLFIDEDAVFQGQCNMKRDISQTIEQKESDTAIDL